MTSQLRKVRAKLGLNDRPVTDTMDLTHLNLQTREDLDALREAAIEDQRRTGGASKLYQQWTEALRRGMDQALPSLRDMEGLGTTGDAIFQETAAAMNSARQVFNPERMDPRLAGLEFDGIPVEEWNPDALRSELQLAMVDHADKAFRDKAMDLIAAIDNSPYGSLASSVEINTPERSMTVEVASADETGGDWYSEQYAASQAQQEQAGLGGLRINTGGTYQVSEADHEAFAHE